MSCSPQGIGDTTELREALVAVGVLPPGYTGGLEVVRIGAGYGLSGTTARVVIEESPRRAVVVKRDAAETIRREQLFYTGRARVLGSSVPGYLGALVDGDTGLLVLEDVAPAWSLDVLAGCDDATAERLVSMLAVLHASTWSDPTRIDPGLPHWRRRAYTGSEWSVRLGTARRRFPDLLDDEATDMLMTLPGRVARVVDRLAGGPQCWIHADAHLDNVLRRPDGTVVLLDWATSCSGPPLVDLAQLLAGGLVNDPTAQRTRITALVRAYTDTLADRGVTGHGIELDAGGSAAAVAEAALPWVQGIVGWAAAPELPTGRAGDVLRAQLAVALAWAR
jgi:aminoglycoside/choline kinase family phosphotransferase